MTAPLYGDAASDLGGLCLGLNGRTRTMIAFGRSADIQVRFVLQVPAHAFERGENIRNCAQRVRHEHSVHTLAFDRSVLVL